MEPEQMAKAMEDALTKTLPALVEQGVKSKTEEMTKTFATKQLELESSIKELNTQLKTAKFAKPANEKEFNAQKFVVKCFQEHFNGKTMEQAKADVKAAFMNEGIAGEGDELVFDQFDKKILNIVESYALVKDAFMYNLVKGDSLTLPKVLNTLTTTWVGEGGLGGQYKATTSSIVVSIKKTITLVDVSSELFEDNMTVPELFNLLVSFIGESMGAFIENQLINGDGTGDNLLGILEDATIPKITMGAGNTSFDNISDDDLIDMIGTSKAIYDKNNGGTSKFYMSRWVKTRLMKIKTTTGQILYPELRASTPTLVGYPVEELTLMPGSAKDAVSTKFLILGNFKNYGLVRRKDLKIEKGVSGDGFKQGIVTLRGEQRFHGAILFNEGFVVLETAAA